MMKKFLISGSVICLVMIGTTVVSKNISKADAVEKIQIHSMMAEYNLEDLAGEATVIAQCTVAKKSASRWNNKDNKRPGKITGKDMIYQDAELKILNVLKGEVSSNEMIHVRTFGGKVDTILFEDESQPELHIGEEVVVFLIPDTTIYNQDKTTDHYIFLGSEQGIYKITGKEIKNFNETLSTEEFSRKLHNHLANKKPMKKIKSEE